MGDWLTPRQAAKGLGVPLETLKKWLRLERIPYRRRPGSNRRQIHQRTVDRINAEAEKAILA